LYRTPGSADEAVRVTPVGTFGTTTVLEQMYKVFVTQRWFDAKTGKAIPSSNFALGAPPNATYVTRIEQIPAADDKTGGPAQGTNREPSSIISEQFGTRGSRGSRSSNNNNIDSILIGGGGRGGRGGRGRGRGGGGSIAMDSFGNAFLVPADFAPQQSSEYIAADEGRRAEIDAILQTDEGRQAIVGGAPLSSLKMATFTRQDSPSLRDFTNAGYCLFALLFGYAGGHFARYVYTRRTGREPMVT
jgi:hypothetical protein